MTRTTQELRAIYAPPCRNVRRVGWVLAYTALDLVFHHHGYRPKAGQTGAQNCRHITGGSNYSLHAYFDDETFTFWSLVRIALALAVDINWNTNPYGHTLHTDMPRAMIDDVYRIVTAKTRKQVWRWGGLYAGNKDAMHFEIVASPAELAEGIIIEFMDGTVVHVGTGQEEDDMAQVEQAEWDAYKVKVDEMHAFLLGKDNLEVKAATGGKAAWSVRNILDKFKNALHITYDGATGEFHQQ